METSTIRILVVDDYELYRHFVAATLSNQPKLQIIAEASDGLAAVQKAQELQPDLILLDIGLPKLNGIEAARQIRKLSPNSKIVFLSQESSVDLVQAALGTGAIGYVFKSEAANHLLPAVEAALADKQFVSASLSAHVSLESSAAQHSNGTRSAFQAGTFASTLRRDQGHVVQFYADDPELLDSLTPLFRESLNAGESAIAIMTMSHRIGFEDRLIAQGIDVGEVIKDGRLTIFDADKELSELMNGGGPDRERFLLQFGNVIDRAQAAAFVKDKRVLLFGEMVALLWAQQRYNTAIQFEELTNELAMAHSLYVCCAYPESEFQGKSRDDEHCASICAQHSEVVSAF